MSSFRPELTPGVFNGRSRGHLPGLLGLQILTMALEGVESRLEVRKEHMAPNGFLHAATVIALADTSCGYGCVAQLPQGASGFTTLELKANFLGTAKDGAIACRAAPVHLGRTTQVSGTPWCASRARARRSPISAARRWFCGRRGPLPDGARAASTPGLDTQTNVCELVTP